MNQLQRDNLKNKLLNMPWTEDLHNGLANIDRDDAIKIVTSFNELEIHQTVNCRMFQEDYIADYIHFLWGVSPPVFWNHVKSTFDTKAGLLWSDNMFYFDMLCLKDVPQEVLEVVVEYIGKCPDNQQDLELLSDIMKSQIQNHGRNADVEKFVTSLPSAMAHIITERLSVMLNQPYKYR